MLGESQSLSLKNWTFFYNLDELQHFWIEKMEVNNPSEEGKEQFIIGLNGILRCWPILRLIVDHGWGEGNFGILIKIIIIITKMCI